MACKRDIKQSLTDKVVELSKTNSRDAVNTMFKTEVIKPSGRVFIPSTLVNQYWDNMQSSIQQAIDLSPSVIKEGVQELFKSNPELASIGTPQQYSNYLDTIFPDSKVKDIVYHGTNVKFEDFDKSKKGTRTSASDTSFGFFFSNKIEEAIKYKGENGELKVVVLNINNPYIGKQDLSKVNENNDSIITENIKTGKRDGVWQEHNEYVVFEPEQIHVLGSKQDIEGFKRFVSIDLSPSVIKEGVQELFKSNSELASIGTMEQYSIYLDTIFPNSVVKEIVYHGSKNNFEKFSKDFLGSNLGQISPDSKLGFFFSNLENAKGFGKNIFTTILNMSNPKIVTEDEYTKLSGGTREFKNKVFSKLLNETKQENKYSLLADFRVSDYMGSKQYVVFEPEQIHILSSKKDLEMFRNFINFTKSEYAKYGDIHQFKDYIMSKNFAAVEEFLVANNKIDRKC